MGARDPRVRAALAWLEKKGTKKGREGMARYGIVATKVFGVSVGDIRRLGRTLGRDHALAIALWDTGWYEARLLAAFVADPKLLTASQMDRWIRECENWADVDTLCFACFDRSPLAWGRVRAWAPKKAEFVRRGSFALLASLALHDKTAEDARFLKALPLIEKASTDGRNFVKKGVSWALRSMARRGPEVRVASQRMAERLAASADSTARWIGRDALRDFGKAAKRKARA